MRPEAGPIHRRAVLPAPRKSQVHTAIPLPEEEAPWNGGARQAGGQAEDAQSQRDGAGRPGGRAAGEEAGWCVASPVTLGPFKERLDG